ncbi:hypothetical protein OB919_15815 [Halobacteria archaeon AArc-curdl1]|uniref:Uncharacterized protein n=1 Tax=Natronosalvus hydrolyticus TaxID=2979988 RepID=A0AAP3E7B5_9EURY|nr:hypothetical protein [Halobacteria archaeon AArc-curdl1]
MTSDERDDMISGLIFAFLSGVSFVVFINDAVVEQNLIGSVLMIGASSLSAILGYLLGERARRDSQISTKQASTGSRDVIEVTVKE